MVTATRNRKVVNEQQWLTMLGERIIENKLAPQGYETNGDTGEPLVEALKVSRGYPPEHALNNRGRAIGVCISPLHSLGGFTEIFVSPYVHDPMPRRSVRDVLQRYGVDRP
jgi:hypothetical protein